MPSPIQENPAAVEAFLLGDFRVEPLRNCLLRGEESVHLRPTAMAVLVRLAAQPRRVLTKEEILTAVWEDRFVSEGVLHNAITELRQALGDDPKQPWSIETIHGTGYRLIAPVIRDLPPSGIYLSPAVRQRRRWLLQGLVLVALAAGALAVLAYFGDRGETPPAGPPFLASCSGTFLCRDAASERAYRLFLRGRDLAAAQEANEAIRLLEEALAEDPRFAYACDLLANLYDTKHLKEFAREKLAACGEAAAKGPFFEWLLRRRRAQIDERWQRELEALGQLARLDPENPEWHHRLGFFYLTHSRECDRSLEQHRQAVAGEPSVRNLTYLAEAQLQCGQEAKALETLDRVRPEDREAKIWWVLRGLALRLNGRTEAAVAVLHGALEAHPQDPWLLTALGDLKLAAGTPDEALELFREARSKSIAESDFGPAVFGEGWALLELGRPEAALKIAQRARESKGSRLEALWLEGSARIAQGDLAAAGEIAGLAEARLAESQSRFQEEWVRHLQGSLAAARGDTAEAARRFQEALDACPLERPYFLRSLERARAWSPSPSHRTGDGPG